jgi:hypothetical protein
VRRILAVTCAAALLAVVRPAHAVGPLDVLVESPEAAPREARLDTGVADGVIAWLAYGQRLPTWIAWGRPLAFEVRFGMPLVSPDLGDSGLEASLQIDAWGHGRWRLRDQLDLGERTTENPVFRGVALLLRDTVSFGWQSPRGGFGVDLGWEQGLATHLHQSDWYQGDIYPGAKDGWLAFPMGRLRTGLYGGVAVGARVFVAARLGLDLDRTGRSSYLPLEAVLTGAFRF